MRRIEIYTTPLCPYCWRAKKLLSQRELEFTEIDLWRHPGRRPEMLSRADGRTSVPQVFIDEHRIGGSDELVALQASGELDQLLNGGSSGGVP